MKYFPMIRLLIADDHTILRHGLKQLFAFVDDITVAAEAANDEQLLIALQREHYDLILLDMNMPGLGGVDLVARIRVYDRLIPILILSMHNELAIVQRALNAGASGYLTKGCGGEVLVEAIRKVANGGHYIEQGLAEQFFFTAGKAGQPLPHERLSKRERQILCLLGGGVGINEIGTELGINSRSVSSHKYTLMKKMNFANHAELVRYAIANDLATEK
jgi:DNA-binding NarL/FixJ family response regulator